MKLIACCIAILAMWTSPVHAHGEEDVKKLVNDYFAAFLAFEWKTVVGMYHPEALVKLRETILDVRGFPKTSAEINDGNRADIESMLAPLKVKTPEEAWALPPEVFYQRMLEFAQQQGTVDRIKKTKTTVKDIKVKKDGDDFHAAAEIENVLEGMLYPVTTHFAIEPLEGELKIVTITKIKRQPQKIGEDGKPEAPEADDEEEEEEEE